jgi:hypothetical protein
VKLAEMIEHKTILHLFLTTRAEVILAIRRNGRSVGFGVVRVGVIGASHVIVEGV